MGMGMVELDLHGKNRMQAKVAIDAALRRADSGTYRIKLIHGYHGGTELKNMIQDEYGYHLAEKVLRIQGGSNPGITELVLREL